MFGFWNTRYGQRRINLEMIKILHVVLVHMNVLITGVTKMNDQVNAIEQGQADLETAFTSVGNIVQDVIFELGELTQAVNNGVNAGDTAALSATAARMQVLKTKMQAVGDALEGSAAKADVTPDTDVGGRPIVPPVQVPLAASFPTDGMFRDAVSSYQGPEEVDLNGASIKDGSTPALAYFSHSADGHVDMVGPSD